MRGITDLQHGLAHREQAAGREVIKAQIKVDEELITGQRHPVRPAGDKLCDPRVHHGDLPLRVSGAIRCPRAAAREPVVPVEPGDLIEHRLGRQLPHAGRWAADDQNDPTVIPRRIADATEPGRQTLT